MTTQDSGFYECIAKIYPTGEVVARHKIRLTVKERLRVILQPPTQTVRPGDTATLDCIVNGDEQSQRSVTWSPVSGVFPE